MKKLYKPGEKPDSTGKYRETGPNGEFIPNARITTNGPGKEKLPQTTKKGNKWIKIR